MKITGNTQIRDSDETGGGGSDVTTTATRHLPRGLVLFGRIHRIVFYFPSQFLSSTTLRSLSEQITLLNH